MCGSIASVCLLRVSVGPIVALVQVTLSQVHTKEDL